MPRSPSLGMERRRRCSPSASMAAEAYGVWKGGRAAAAAAGGRDGFRGSSGVRVKTGDPRLGRVRLRRWSPIVFPFLLDKEKEVVFFLFFVFFRLSLGDVTFLTIHQMSKKKM